MRNAVSPRHSSPADTGLSVRRLGCMLGLMIVVSLTALASGASADVSLCSAGTGPGQCKEPTGLAVDPASGHLYVADRSNNRIDVFDSTAAEFLFAFGWGVADGSSAEPQICTVTCFKGLAGGGAGEFEKPEAIAVDPAAPHDVYVIEQFRVQKFSPSGEFIATWGGGVISGGASGKGDLSSGSGTVTNVVTTKKAFAPGQAISGPGIPAGTKITALGEGTITLSKTATASGAGVALSVAEGAGNVPVNETQVFTSKGVGDTFPIGRLRFATPNPSPSEAAADFDGVNPPPASGPGSLQQALESLPNIGAGNVAVTGVTGGPYTIEFKGPRFADTDVSELRFEGSGTSTVVTTQNGASGVETCTAANAVNCSAGIEGTGPGQFAKETRIAVGPGGVIYVSDCAPVGESRTCKSRVQKFEPSGAFSEELVLPGAEFIRGLAVDSSGDFYVGRSAAGVEKFDPSGNPVFSLNVNGVQAVAVDSADNLFVSHLDGNSQVVTEFDSSGAILSRFGYETIKEGFVGIAVNSTPTGDVFGSEPFNDRIHYLSSPASGALPCCLQAQLSNTKATLEGGVNPEGKAASYHFDYITEADFKANGNSFTGPKPFDSTPESPSVGSDFTRHDAEAVIGCANPGNPPQASCLKPSTPYRYRLVAKNKDGENTTAEAQFKTKPPFEVLETYATDVGTDAASLHATINPLGIQTTAYFEYVDDAAYQADKIGGHDGFSTAIKVPDVDGGKAPIDLGSGAAPMALGVELTSLASGTLYHYRVLVTDSFVTDSGPERTFATFLPPSALGNPCPNAAFRGGASATLPDCRAYEMVSPVDKNGNDIRVLGNGPSYPARLDQSSTDGNRFTYSSGTSFGDAKSAPWSSQYLASRTATGWSNHSINTPRETPSLAGAATKFDVPYKFFSPELDNGWVYQDANPPLDECGTEGFTNLYRRDNATGEYEALLSTKPLAAVAEGRLELQGVSADGTKSVFRAEAKLTKDAAASGFQLYEHVKGEGCGELRLVNILPSGKASPKQASAGTPSGLAGEYRENTVAHAVSEDGSQVVFTLSAIGPGPLYVRVNADQDQSVVSAGKCTETEKGCTVEISSAQALFWTASVDGSTVIYSVGSELFEFDVSKALAGEPASTLIAAQANGVVGASEDASRIYLVSSEELGGKGIADRPNLYSYEPGKSGAERFGLVATLSAEDLVGFGNFGFSLASPRPIANGVRLTGDAGHLAFVSTERLTDYDNTDATDGRPALEIYLYDFDSGKLACISCNPSGGRPRGRGFSSGEVIRRVSAQLPSGESQTFAPRALSDDANRLFFESFEALLSGDTNGKADVYEWQRASGAEQCEEVGAGIYVPSAGGCLSLISTGQSPVDSELADVSPDGHDVFIRTASSLLPQDPGLIDIYDARIDGGFPQPPGLPAACEGEACQGPPSPPNDPTPASSAFNGAGNVKQPPARCRKPKVRRKGRCVAKKIHRHQKHSQTSHKRRAGR